MSKKEIQAKQDRIKKGLKVGISTMKADKNLTDMIKAEVIEANETGSCHLTTVLDEMLTTGTDQSIKDIKQFIRTKLQTLIKCKPTQKSILGEDAKNYQITIKKVNLPMIENLNNEYVNNFTEDDLGKIKVVKSFKKKKEEKTLIEDLIKLMDKHLIETDGIRNAIKEIENGKQK
jgi:hypothetical protein